MRGDRMSIIAELKRHEQATYDCGHFKRHEISNAYMLDYFPIFVRTLDYQSGRFSIYDIYADNNGRHVCVCLSANVTLISIHDAHYHKEILHDISYPKTVSSTALRSIRDRHENRR